MLLRGRLDLLSTYFRTWIRTAQLSRLEASKILLFRHMGIKLRFAADLWEVGVAQQCHWAVHPLTLLQRCVLLPQAALKLGKRAWNYGWFWCQSLEIYLATTWQRSLSKILCLSLPPKHSTFPGAAAVRLHLVSS